MDRAGEKSHVTPKEKAFRPRDNQEEDHLNLPITDEVNSFFYLYNSGDVI
jgi:hypothetical protein